jgi:hypothetical protein
VVQIAEKLIEPVHGGQEPVAIAQVVLAELAAAARSPRVGCNPEDRPSEADHSK